MTTLGGQVAGATSGTTDEPRSVEQSVARRGSVETDRAAAAEFLELFHAENPPSRSSGAADGRGHARDRLDRHLLAHAGGAGVRRPRRLAQQRPVHWPPLLAQPAGTRPAYGLRRPRRRRALLRPPASRQQRRQDPSDDQRVRSGSPVAAGSQDLERAAHPLRRLWPAQRWRPRRPPLSNVHEQADPARLAVA